MSFVHLHVHTEYSLLDGSNKIKEYVARVKELGMNSAAITDHGVMYGAVEFYKEAKKRGIRPIIGCEVYVARRTRFDKIHELDKGSRHLVLLCENDTGYRNLIALVSQAWVEGFYTKPRVDLDLLRQHHEGLIALSACAANDENARIALEQLPKLRGCQVHTTVLLSDVDKKIFKKLGIDLTCEPVHEDKKINADN